MEEQAEPESEAALLVLGASGGLGAAVARRLRAYDGGRLILHGNGHERVLAGLAAELGAETVVADLTRPDGVAALSAVLAGVPALAGLVSCIGVNPSVETTAEISPADFTAALDVNVTAVWRSLAVAMPQLRAHGSASVVLVGSVFGVRTPAMRAAYGASKHALTGLVQAIAQEERGVVRANVVAPGAMPGPHVEDVFAAHAEAAGTSVEAYVAARRARIPRDRFLTYEECANVCAFLLASESSGVDGQCITVDAGER